MCWWRRTREGVNACCRVLFFCVCLRKSVPMDVGCSLKLFFCSDFTCVSLIAHLCASPPLSPLLSKFLSFLFLFSFCFFWCIFQDPLVQLFFLCLSCFGSVLVEMRCPCCACRCAVLLSPLSYSLVSFPVAFTLPSLLIHVVYHARRNDGTRMIAVVSTCSE